MAKKKAESLAPAKEKARAIDQVDFVRIRVKSSWKNWLTRFADSERSDMSDLIDDALASYANIRGFESPPKR